MIETHEIEAQKGLKRVAFLPQFGFFCIEPVLEIVETALFTACVRDENPVSMILIGPSGIAKSMMLTHYAAAEVRRSDSISSQGLFDLASTDHKNELKFLVIPDMNPTLSRKPTTVQRTIANLL